MPKQSAPRWMASRASSSRSSPLSSTTVSTPKDDARLRRSNRSTFPPPDQGLQIRTGREGTWVRWKDSDVEGSRIQRRARRAKPSVAISRTKARASRTKDVQSSLPAPTIAKAMRTTPAPTSRNPTTRRTDSMVMAHQPPTIARPTPTRPATMYTPLRNKATTTPTVRSAPAPREAHAIRRAGHVSGRVRRSPASESLRQGAGRVSVHHRARSSVSSHFAAHCKFNDGGKEGSRRK